MPALPFSFGSLVAGSMWSISSWSVEPHTAQLLSASQSARRWQAMRVRSSLVFPANRILSALDIPPSRTLKRALTASAFTVGA